MSVDEIFIEAYENHAQDSRVKVVEVVSFHAKAGTGGNNLPLVTALRQGGEFLNILPSLSQKMLSAGKCIREVTEWALRKKFAIP